jgi:hypothetical protein
MISPWQRSYPAVAAWLVFGVGGCLAPVSEHVNPPLVDSGPEVVGRLLDGGEPEDAGLGDAGSAADSGPQDGGLVEISLAWAGRSTYPNPDGGPGWESNGLSILVSAVDLSSACGQQREEATDPREYMSLRLAITGDAPIVPGTYAITNAYAGDLAVYAYYGVHHGGWPIGEATNEVYASSGEITVEAIEASDAIRGRFSVELSVSDAGTPFLISQTFFAQPCPGD